MARDYSPVIERIRQGLIRAGGLEVTFNRVIKGAIDKNNPLSKTSERNFTFTAIGIREALDPKEASSIKDGDISNMSKFTFTVTNLGVRIVINDTFNMGGENFKVTDASYEAIDNIQVLNYTVYATPV